MLRTLFHVRACPHHLLDLSLSVTLILKVSLLQYYLQMIPFAEARTKTYFGHEGVFFVETKTLFGTTPPYISDPVPFPINRHMSGSRYICRRRLRVQPRRATARGRDADAVDGLELHALRLRGQRRRY